MTRPFREYLLRRKRAYSATGEFVEVIRKDSAVLNVASFDELDSLLKKRGMSATDREVAKMLWNSYERSRQ